MTDIALLPCPFCGAPEEEIMMFCDPDEGRDNSGLSRRVQCAVCHIEAPFYPTEVEAIAAWNRRASPSQVAPANPVRGEEQTWQKPGERVAQGTPADEQSGETSHVANPAQGVSEAKLPATKTYVDRLIRIFRDHPTDDTSAVVLIDYARAALASIAPQGISAVERFARWLEDGPKLAKEAGCYVGIKVTDAPPSNGSRSIAPQGGEGER